MKKLFAFLALSLALCAPLAAQIAAQAAGTFTLTRPEVPTIVTDGFNAYAKGGADSAMSVWCKGSPMESDLTLRMNTISNLSKFESAYGKYMGWELVKVYSLTPSTMVVFAAAKYEKGPFWLAFSCYKATDTWTITLLGMDTVAMRILPSSAFKE